MDVDKLLKALDKDENEELINTSSEQINNSNRSVIEELELPIEEQETYLEKLDGWDGETFDKGELRKLIKEQAAESKKSTAKKPREILRKFHAKNMLQNR